MDIMGVDIATFLKIGGGVIGCLATTFFAIVKLYDTIASKKEKQQDRHDDRRYQRELKLEKDKVTIQKELESTKQRHAQKLIDAIKGEMGDIKKEVKKLSESFIRVDEKLINNAATQARNFNMVNDFISTTTTRFRILEQEVKSGSLETRREFKSQIVKIKEDLVVVKSIANKVRIEQKSIMEG